MGQLYPALIAAGVSVIGALATFITTRLKFKSVNGYYVICPNCGKKIFLSETTIQKVEDSEE